jgi:excisionase family DNA binding protein
MKKSSSNNGAFRFLLTGPQLAAALGEKERTILTWRQNGLIPHYRFGHRSVRYRLDAVKEALAKRQVRELV